MGRSTHIEWADHTFNPWMGCMKVGPGCDNCYAEARMDHRLKRVRWGAGQPRVRTSAANWNQPLVWNRAAAAAGKRPFVFCASLADVFDKEVPAEWRADLYRLVEETPHLVWLFLTKRIGNAFSMLPDRLPGNVAIGATFVNQEEYDRDNPKLWRAKQGYDPIFTFGSFEPLLGRVSPDQYAPDWLIVGGESGRNARPFYDEWASHIRSRAIIHRRVFNFKQHGGSGADKGGHLLDGKAYLDRPMVHPIHKERLL